MKKIFTLLAVAALPALTYAQSQRLVLVEHFSNASCGPCAAANPAFNALVAANSGTVVSIKYQTNWPGTDPMNAHNPTEVANRVSLYGVTGVPNSVVDGNVYNDHPGGVSQSMFTNRSNVASPFTVNLAQQFSPGGDSIRVTATITRTGTVPAGANLKLHMAVIEKNIWFQAPPGSNGETHFPSVMKKMLPNASGTVLPAMNVGDTETISYSWKLANIYDMGQVASVAFIQNTGTKEVLQAGFQAPNFPVQMAIQNVDGTKAKIAGENAQSTYNLKFKTTSANADTYKLRLNKSMLPSGWSAEFTVGGQTYSDSAVVNMAAAADSQSVMVKINTGSLANQKGTVKLESSSTTAFSNYMVSGAVTAFSSIRTAWVNKGSSNNTFLNSFNNAGTTTVQLTADEFSALDPAGFTGANVDHIFLNTGAEYSATLLSDEEISNLSAYLMSGGKLFASGQDIGYSAFQGGGSNDFKSFYESYLGAEYMHDGDDDGVAIAAEANDAIFGSLPNTNLSTGAFTLYSDIIGVSPISPNASPIINYTNLAVQGYTGTTGVAAVRNNESNWKVVYTSFRPEAIASAAFRDQLIDKAIDWFDGIISSAQFDQEVAGALSIFPNPANAEFTVALGTTNASVIKVVDMLGRVVISKNISAGETASRISTAGLESGTYFVQVEGGAKVNTQKLVIVK